MTNIGVLNTGVLNTGVLYAGVLYAGVLYAEPWRARLGACCPRSTFPGTSVPGAGGGTGLAVAMQSVPRVRGKAGVAIPVPQSALMAQLGQINNDNHMTSVFAGGEGASGPPPYREPA